MILHILNYTILSVALLLGVSFYTLLERNVLGLGHYRSGPLLVSFQGILQPISDGLKLFVNEAVVLFSSVSLVYFLAPLVLLGLSFSYLLCLSVPVSVASLEVGLITFLVLLSLSVYPSLATGWSPTSTWCLLGSLRVLAQVISYEVSLSFLFVSFLILWGSWSVSSWQTMSYCPLFMVVFLVLLIGLSLVAELNRTPFDLGEAESELVSGVNIEYSGGLFAVLFISEYLNIIVLSCLFVTIAFCSLSILYTLGWVMICLYTLVWLRVSLPRIRYDKLISLCWLVLLPVSLVLLNVVLVEAYDLNGCLSWVYCCEV